MSNFKAVYVINAADFPAGGGGGSVTSTELSAAVAVETSNRVSADNALSTAINTVSNAVSIVSQALSNEISDRTSADGVLSVRVDSVANAVSIVSQALSVLSQSNSAAHVSLDGRATSLANAISTISQQVSVLSQANSAAHVSLDGRATSLANAISIVSNAASNALSVANAVSQAHSALSQANSAAHASLQTAINTVSNALSAQKISGHADTSITSPISGQVLKYKSVSAQWINASDNTAAGGGSVTSTELSAGLASVASIASVEISNRISADNVLSAAINTVSNNLSAQKISGHADTSITAPVSNHVLKYKSASSQWINSPDLTGGAGGSVTSTELSAGLASVASIASVEISNRISANNVLSARVDSVGNAVSIVSNAASNALSVANAVSAAHASLASVVSVHHDVLSVMSVGAMTRPQFRMRETAVTVSLTGITGIASLSCSMAANAVYQIDIFARFSVGGSAASGQRWQISLPAGTSIGGGGIVNRTSGQGVGGGAAMGWNTASTTIATSIPAGTQGAIRYEGIVGNSTAGTAQLMVAASAGGNIVIMGGSYFRAWRLS